MGKYVKTIVAKDKMKGTFKNREIWHTNFLSLLAEIIQPINYLELGVGAGANVNEVKWHVKEITVGVDNNEKAFIKGMKHGYYGDTDDFFKEKPFGDIKYDLIFIDANHNINFVKRDFYNSLKVLSDRGIIALHDTYPLNKKMTKDEHCGKGYLFIKELVNDRKDLEVFTIPVHPGLTLVRVSKYEDYE